MRPKITAPHTNAYIYIRRRSPYFTIPFLIKTKGKMVVIQKINRMFIIKPIVKSNCVVKKLGIIKMANINTENRAKYLNNPWFKLIYSDKISAISVTGIFRI